MIRFEIFQGQCFGDPWYWQAKARNGKTIADGAEGYAKKSNARRAVHRFVSLLGATDFVIVERD